MRLVLWVVLILVCLPVGAESAARQLDGISQNLEAIVADLESSQAQVSELRGRLEALEALSSQHQEGLRSQGRLLADYQAAVVALEAHDRASLALSEDLRRQLESERRASLLPWTVAGVALMVAVVEGVVLGVRR